MIKKIIYVERVKTLYFPIFKTLLAIHAILFMLVALVASNININIQGVAIEKLFHFPHIWNTFSWFASWFNLLLGILAIMLITNEFQNRTFRKQLIDGLSRNELLAGKVFVFVALAIYAMLLVFISGLIMGAIKSPTFNLGNIAEGITYLPVLFIQSLGYMLFAMLFAFLFRNSALSTVSFILFFFPIEPIIRMMLPDGVDKFMPVKIISNLTPMPDFIGISLSDVIDLQMYNSPEFQSLNMFSKTMPWQLSALLVCGYCFLFVLISKIIVSRRNF